MVIPLAFLLVGTGGILADHAGEYRALSLLNRDYWGVVSREGKADPGARGQLETALEEYIHGRPHPFPRTVRTAHWMLFLLVRDDPGHGSEDLLRAVRGMTDGASYREVRFLQHGAVALSRAGYTEEAESLVWRGLEEVRETFEQRREEGRYEDDAEYREARDRMSAGLLGARGLIALETGEIGEAHRDLLRAHEASPEDGHLLHYLGLLFERKAGDAVETAPMSSWKEGEGEGALAHWNRAAEYFARGTLANWFHDFPNPNYSSLRALYRERHGSLEGFEAFYDEITREDREAKREKILARREKEPKRMPPFRMVTLAGDTVRSEDLAGKVLVVNFWGTWCTPCVKELPELQLLSERYADSDDVAVLTVACKDRSPEYLREWMTERGYDYPVLWNDGYARSSGVRGYPTTWFVGRDGTIVYEVLGTTTRLLEEFGWRAEALAGSRPVASRVTGGPG